MFVVESVWKSQVKQSYVGLYSVGILTAFTALLIRYHSTKQYYQTEKGSRREKHKQIAVGRQSTISTTIPCIMPLPDSLGKRTDNTAFKHSLCFKQ